MNERLCKVCAALDETERNRDRRPFTGRDPKRKGTRPGACVAGGQKLWRTPIAMDEISRPGTATTWLTVEKLPAPYVPLLSLSTLV